MDGKAQHTFGDLHSPPDRIFASLGKVLESLLQQLCTSENTHTHNRTSQGFQFFANTHQGVQRGTEFHDTMGKRHDMRSTSRRNAVTRRYTHKHGNKHTCMQTKQTQLDSDTDSHNINTTQTPHTLTQGSGHCCKQPHRPYHPTHSPALRFGHHEGVYSRHLGKSHAPASEGSNTETSQSDTGMQRKGKSWGKKPRKQNLSLLEH